MSTVPHGTPFRMAMLFAAAIAEMGMELAVQSMGPYEGRGKGRNRLHDGGGTIAFQRAAAKKRNRAAHRRHCRG